MGLHLANHDADAQAKKYKHNEFLEKVYNWGKRSGYRPSADFN